MKTYQVNQKELNDINQFLLENHMIYKSKEEVKNKRLANFLGNFTHSDVYGELIHYFENQTVLIIGLGTVGSSLVDGLLQFGVKKYILIDCDKVEEGNIPHQRIFGRKDIGNNKTETVAKRIKDVIPDSTITVKNIFVYSISDIKKLVDRQDISAVFCCFDQYNASLLNDLYHYFSNRSIPMYLSGYQVGGKSTAVEVTEKQVQDFYSFEDTNEYILADNSGIGILGDLSAIMMIRLWLKNLGNKWELESSTLHYDFFTPDYQFMTQENPRPAINSIHLKHLHTLGSENAHYIKEKIIFPRVLELYRGYLSGDELAYETIKNLDEQHELGFLDLEEKSKIEYVGKASQIMIPYHDSEISILQFRDFMLSDPHVETITLKAYNNAIKELTPYAMEALKVKHNNYISYYQNVWKQYQPLKEVLTSLSKSITHKLFPNEVDYTKYKPYFAENYTKTAEEELDIIRSIDEHNPYLDLSGFIDYSIQHRFLHLVENGDNLVCIYNPRYGNSDIVIAHSKKWGIVFDMVHEISHAYYFSQLGGHISEIDPLTSETLSILSEIQLMDVLRSDFACKEYLQAILYKFQGRFSGMFTLDVYEEEVLKLPEYTLEEIMKVRQNLIKDFTEGIFIKNEKYSQHNILLSLDLLFTVREPYVYSHAMLLAFDLYNRIQNVPSLQIQLNQYLNNCNENDKPNIFAFYQNLKINIDTQFYYSIAEKICNYIDDILCQIRCLDKDQEGYSNP